MGTKPYIPHELRGWKVTQSASVSRHAFEGAGVLRAYGSSLPARDPREPRHQRRPEPGGRLPGRRPRRDGRGRAAPLRGLDEHRAPAGRGRQLRGLQPGACPGVPAARESESGQLGAHGSREPAVGGGRRRARERRRLPRPGEGDRPLGAALPMSARLYVTSLSNPSRAAIAMVAYKQLPHRVITLTSGFHPYLVRAAGFEGRTVPALRLDDGRRVQGSLAISRALDELIAERPLFPDEPGARRAVERAERWGNDELQPVPRRIFRWAAVQRPRGATLDRG